MAVVSQNRRTDDVTARCAFLQFEAWDEPLNTSGERVDSDGQLVEARITTLDASLVHPTVQVLIRGSAERSRVVLLLRKVMRELQENSLTE